MHHNPTGDYRGDAPRCRRHQNGHDMPKVLKISKPPRGLTGDDLHEWYEDAADTAAKEHYENELYKARDKRRAAEEALDPLKQELADAKAALPGDDSIVLKGADKTKWENLSTLDVPDLQRKAKEGEKLTEEKRLTDITSTLGLNPTTFTDFVLTRGLKVDTDKAGTPDEQHVIVHDVDGKEQRTEVMEYLTSNFEAWLPALVTGDQPRQPITPRPPAPPTPGAGRLPSNHRTGKPGDVQREFLAKREAEATASRNVFTQKITGPIDGGKQ